MNRLAPQLVLILSAGMWSITAHATTAGSTAGAFAVTNTGAASYSIPIWAPPGPNGMQPNVALVYNSQSGNGVVGVGWNIAGLSSISRCNLTYAQDAGPAPVSLSTSDGYCLDGQRLRLTSGTYGTAGSTYQTEIANFSNITAYGAAGNGPAYFIVQTPDGRSYQYGNGGNSQVLATGTSTAVSWMVNRVSDIPGNTMTISYVTTNGVSSVAPSIISWTPTSLGAGSYAYTMTFNYSVNPNTASAPSVTGACLAPAAATASKPGTSNTLLGNFSLPVCILNGYVSGSQVQQANLLNSITVSYSGAQVKQYVLTYTASGTTGRETLTQVQECAASTSNCLNPTIIGYQSGTAGVSTSGSITSSSVSTAIAHYDFNGDGYTDVVYQSGTAWYVAFGSASGYGTPVNTGLTGKLLFGDILGVGRDGILAKNGTTWYYYTWNGSSFVGTSTGLTYDTTVFQFILADINGDGLPDLVAQYQTSAVTLTTRLNTSSGGTPSFSGSTVTAYTVSGVTASLIGPDSQTGNLRSFDFNGDGRQDLAITWSSCTVFYGPTCVAYTTIVEALLSQSSGAFGGALLGYYVGSAPVYPIFANVNDDACTDMITQQRYVTVSACNGSVATTYTATYPIAAALDWNGDGVADLIETNPSGVLYVQAATGSGFGTATSTGLSSPVACGYFAFDANGDGLDDLGCIWSGGIAYNTHGGGGTPADLLISIADGFGNSASPSYASIVQSSYTGVAGTYPDAAYIRPIYVVNSVTYSDPSSTSGGTYTQSFTYAGSFMNIQGRGWDGFGSYTTSDSRSGLSETRSQWIAFPNTGLPDLDNVYSGAQQISQFLGTPAVTTLSSASYQQRFFPYLSNVTRQSWEFGGAENGILITTSSTNYSYDNFGNVTTIAQTTTDDDPGYPSTNPYHGDAWTTTVTNTPAITTSPPPTSPWCLNLFTQTLVAYTATVGSPVTRTKQLSPDLTNCRYSQLVTEPLSGTYKVTEALGYDSFGNMNSDSVTGIGMSARTSSANWGTTGQLPASFTDPSGAQTQFNYNWSFGLPSSKTDPNGLITSWTYGDGFGRMTQETRPDGTYTTITYVDASAWTPFHGTVLVSSVYSNTATFISSNYVVYDPANRPVISAPEMLSNFGRTDIRYDNLGRIKQQSFPCTFSAWATTCPYWMTASYDALNRTTQVQRPISSTNSSPEAANYAYAGRTTTIADPYSNQRTIITDVNGWQRQTIDALSYAISTTYDAAGSKSTVTDSLSNTLWTGTYAYGVRAFLTSKSDMDLGAWSYTYDALGERTSWTDAKGQSFSATFDALSRPLTRAEPDLYTAWTWGSSAGSHNIGSLQSVCTGTGSSPTNCTASPGYSESETYDSLARPAQRSITLPGTGTFNYQWAYDSTTGLLSTLTYPTSTSSYALELQYGYSNGILQSVTDISDPTHVVVWTANAANPAGQVTQETLGNGLVTTRTYDAVTQWLGAVTSGVGGGAGVQNQSFLFDEVGNVTERQDNNLGLTENSYYDNDYRLTSTKLNGTPNLSITYDGTGNITSRSDVASGATWTYDPVRKHAVTQAGSSAYTYTYDANGNATSRQGGTVNWYSYNYPSSVSAGSGSTAETIAFAYGPDRSRWQQNYTGNSTTETTDYIGGLLDLVTSGGVSDYRHYIYAGNEPVAVYSRKSTGANTFSYLLSDHEGSVASITSSSGAVDVSESFTPFGTRRNPATWSGAASTLDLTTAAGLTRQGYTFQTQLGLWMGLNHMNGRVQDSITGRFLTADPNIPDRANPQDYNRYSYVDNNPLTFVDPSGFCLDGVRDLIIYTPASVAPDGTEVPPGYEDICTAVPQFHSFDVPPGAPPGLLIGLLSSGVSPISVPAPPPPPPSLCEQATTAYENMKKEGPSAVDAAGNALAVTEFSANQTVSLDAKNLAPSTIRALSLGAKVAKVGGGMLSVGQVGYGVVNGIRTGQTGDLLYQSIDILADIAITAAGGGGPGALGAIAYNLNGGSKQLVHPNPRQAAAQAMISACQDEIH